ncbi:HAD family hydrolase [Pseudescherichia vulneris]
MRKIVLLSPLLLSCVSYAASNPVDPLSAWKETPVKQAIEKWVQESTRDGSPNYIPLDKRYVVFDNDGTLWPEAPLTFQLQFAMDEIKRLAPANLEWKNDPLVMAVLNDDFKTVAASGDKGLLKLVALTHSGMTTEEFSHRVSHWLDSHKNRHTGCRYDQLGYQPMRQLLDYLRANGFKTWIVSGGGSDFMRVMSQKMYGIPPEQVIGSFALTEFRLTKDGPQLRKTMKGAFNDDKAMKPVAIHLFMGQRPVAAFGNSDGDLAMLQYTSANPDYKTFEMLIHHTDAIREYAYDSHPPASGKLVDGLALAAKQGWSIVDMKQDWNRVYDPELCRK